MSNPVAATRDLSKTLGPKPILRSVSIELTEGNVVGLIGKNGAGKTTLLDVLLGFSPATSGSSALFGEDSFSLPDFVKRRIGYVPQQDELIDSLTGAQQLALTASLHARWDRPLIERLVADWSVPLARPVQSMSGGERQKLSTLLALGHTPDLLVLDEPASSLDPVARRQLLREILEIAGSPARTVLFSSHLVSDLERVVNQVWVIRDGAIAWQGDLDLLKESVARLHIQSRDRLPPALAIPGSLRERVEGIRAEVVVADWSDSRRQPLEDRFGAQVTVERLSLEEIFLELHR